MDGFVARLRGLPWSTTAEDLVKFFDECQIAGGEKGVHLTVSREGRASGEAFVEFESEEDVEKGIEKHNSHLGSRYIEVFRSKKSEMEWVVKRMGADHSNMSEACVKLRGLPFGCSKEEIAQFFTGFEIVPNGIMLPEDRLGRSTGEAFVQFASQEIAEKALGKHKERIGHRYIEIFKSSLAEANAVTGRDRGFRGSMGMGRPGPYDRGDRFGGPMGPGGGSMGMGYSRGGRGGRNVKGFFEDDFDDYNGGGFGFGGRGGRGGMRGRYPGMMDDRRNGPPGSQYISKTGHSVHMRGLPFQAQEQDIFEFFSPIQPVRVNFDFGGNGRPTGEANVDFATHQEAMEAMKKHKTNMQHRYIELFLNSTPSPRNSSEGGSYGGADMGSGFVGGNMGNNMGGMGTGMGTGMGGGGGYSNNGGNFGAGSNMGGGYNNMGSGSVGSGMGAGNMGGSMSAGGMGSGGMGGGSMTGGMGAGNMSGGMGGGNMGTGMGGSNMGSGMGGGYGGQGQFGASQQYGSSNMGGGGYGSMGGASGQSGGYGNQGMSSNYMSGNGGGYSSMGSSAMNNLANPNYTAF
ncbi:heterogeneous nuclear ribonucleoprotein H2-like [Littorina saxatilis]|uniref:RRM domain-containing protein n=1 Tax=Littorina saxatilis TaxID=31220 RepID=A0AAN9C352_9CAEN